MTFHPRGGRAAALASCLIVLSISVASAPALIAAEHPAGALRARAASDDTRQALIQQALIQQALKTRSQSRWGEALAIPGVCGDGIPNPGETCDDGNTAPGDGCSATCQVEPGWECTPAGVDNAVADGSLEQGSPNPDWAQTGEQFTPICSELTCGASHESCPGGATGRG